MSDFKVGDKVVCIDNKYLECDMLIGGLYTIIGFEDNCIKTKEFGRTRLFGSSRFVLVRDYAEQPPKFNTSGSKYLRDIKTTPDGKIDVYAVLIAFNVTSPARQHAIKKLLCAGIRGKNNELNDIEEARDAVERDVQLLNN